MSRIRIGVSGWRYKSWRGPFYPPKLRQREELAFAASQLGSVEINGSFYSLQRPTSFAAWASETPTDFVFALKGGRFITHMKKLRDVRGALANYFASGLFCLGRKLGPILWQFPENMPADLERFADFFELLPRTPRAAGRLAREHGAFMDGRTVTRAAQLPAALRYAVEIRNPASATPELVALLRRHNIALVVADTAGRFPACEDVTADFVYVRLHGDTKLYASGYGPRAIADWARRIQSWHAGDEPADARCIAGPAPAAFRGKPRDVYVYFDNDMHAHAPRDALSLQRALSRAVSGLCDRGCETRA
jgi:uncharacterized protein YecE (DUF72 family)